MLNYYLDDKMNNDIGLLFENLFKNIFFYESINVDEIYEKYCEEMLKNGGDELLDSVNSEMGLDRKYFY